MKTLLLATAAFATFAAAPAFAQDAVGSIGVRYNNSEVEAGPLNADSESATLDAAVAIPVAGDWTVTLDGGFAYAIDGASNQDNSNLNGRVHASRVFGSTRFGAFAGGAEASGEQLWSFGGEAQHYLSDKITLTGSVAYETVESADADIWNVGGDVAYYISPNFRVNGGAGWTTVDAAVVDVDGWQANVGGEYQFADTGISLTANYGHAELKDVDVKSDTIMVGLRFTFGGDLKTRERSGADLGRTVAGIGGLAGAF